jgi:hypothetical protein
MLHIRNTLPGLALGALLTTTAVPAHAHFKLLTPTSWLNEDTVGGPQKGSPCGPGGMGLLGDDVQPVPTNGMVSEVHAGDTILVDMQETVYHPGYFRIALAEDRKTFTIPPVSNPMSCDLDLTAVPTGSHDNVLMDGLFKETAMTGSNRHLMQMVKIPDKPCDKCTLQVVQVMYRHGLSSCYYYHCADLRILPSNGSSGGAGTAAGGTSAAGAGGIHGTGSAGTAAAGGNSAAAAGSGGARSPTAGTLAGSTAGTVPTSSNPGTAGATGQTATTVAGAGSAGVTSTSLPKAGAGAGATTPSAAAAPKSGCSVVRAGPAHAHTRIASSVGMLLMAAFAARSRQRRARHLRQHNAR